MDSATPAEERPEPPTEDSAEAEDPHKKQALLALSVGALGVVYGDIGTSPIYAVREVFNNPLHPLAAAPESVLGVISLVFWALMIIVTVKYLGFVLRADNHGEGGILALTALVKRHMPKHRRALHFLLYMGLFGTALLFGDGMLTPAVSVLSAIEGLNTATTAFEPYIVLITVIILIGLFLIQKRGTEKVGKMFGPIMVIWFSTLAVVGVSQVVCAPEILQAVLPQHALGFLLHNGWLGFTVLGSVFLAVTGGEALYADLGHFGARPIRLAWFAFAMPALCLNYLGQGALLLHSPEAFKDPYYNMVPPWAIYPMVALTAAATVIASQALITGTYSLTMQAVQFRYLPRIHVDHTSEREVGQIYVPTINWALMVACVLLVLTFRTSSNLAAAYGVAVTLTMVITTVLFYFMLRYGYGWSRWRAGGLCGFFLTIEMVFFLANAIKIPHGGWIPLVVGGILFLLMLTWRAGRQRITAIRSETGLPLAALIQNLNQDPTIVRVPGTAIFMHPDPERIPPALLHNIQHNHVVHEKNLVVAVTIEAQPYMPAHEIARTDDLGSSFHRVLLRFGYMDRPDVPAALHTLTFDGEPLDSGMCSYFLARETILPRAWLWSGMGVWREKLFALMARNAQDATEFFNIPPGHVIEVGSQIEI